VIAFLVIRAEPGPGGAATPRVAGLSEVSLGSGGAPAPAGAVTGNGTVLHQTSYRCGVMQNSGWLPISPLPL
jgi:hypothetical protein